MKAQSFKKVGMDIWEKLSGAQGVYVYKAVGRFADGTYFNKIGDVTFLH